MGAAGATCAQQLRTLEPKAEITIVNGEGLPFYLRLDLASILEGKDSSKLIARKDDYWIENNIQVVYSQAVKLDSKAQTVLLENGEQLAYDKLLIASGAQARRLTCPGAELKEIATYRTLKDAIKIYELRDKLKQVVIVGGGILGMEVAYAARAYDWDITLLVRESHVGAPLIDEEGGGFIQQALEQGGVNVIYEDEVARYEGSDKVEAVVTEAGRRLPANLVIECIGVAPDLRFLEELGIIEGGRVRVNEGMRTTVPTLFAAGDAAVVKMLNGHDVTCHNWNVAIAQARVAAEAMTGRDAKWNEGVYYNADRFYDQEFAIIGPWERRTLSGRKLETQTTSEAFRAVVSVNGVIESALVVGDKTGNKLLRRLIASRAKIEGKFDRLFDPEATAGAFE
ncbi:FAD-dependent oxidoreductase [bacterium]|nr:MAG: FAD-dependent oxidoreductase [bacterium]